MFERVLVPLDESELSHRILVVVRRLLRTSPRAEIRLARVLSREQAEKTGALDPVADARAHLDRVVEILGRDGFRATSVVLVGDAASEILDQADAWEPTLVAMASHGRSGISRWVRGSVAERVLVNARHPLLVANPAALPLQSWLARDAGSADLARETEFRRVLVPLDGSEASASILPAVREFALAHEAQVTLLHVAAPGDPPIGDALDIFQERLRGVSVRQLVRTGDPASVILDEASEQGYDLVALTTHGATQISRWTFGSVAERVIRHCSAPLLVRRTAGFAAGSSELAAAHATVLPTE